MQTTDQKPGAPNVDCWKKIQFLATFCIKRSRKTWPRKIQAVMKEWNNCLLSNLSSCKLQHHSDTHYKTISESQTNCLTNKENILRSSLYLRKYLLGHNLTTFTTSFLSFYRFAEWDGLSDISVKKITFGQYVLEVKQEARNSTTLTEANKVKKNGWEKRKHLFLWISVISTTTE